ncbi:MAG: EscU/YscU/HrcU family type III secretion system export apparatus switch protein [Calditerricola sp.]|jgi:Uncharacterized homolog of the cytoplasmic domain of flagellar protein FhlB|nr:EscU/YscU/HrcU family type III secretion system export apparatus switch protein [Calditerricola sp.]
MTAQDDRQRQRTSLRRAVALRYQPPRDEAPRVVAKGAGAVAERIIAEARAHGVPLHEDPALVAVLSQLDLDQVIPPSLYPVVAEILALLYHTDRALGQREAPSS